MCTWCTHAIEINSKYDEYKFRNVIYPPDYSSISTIMGNCSCVFIKIQVVFSAKILYNRIISPYSEFCRSVTRQVAFGYGWFNHCA